MKGAFQSSCDRKRLVDQTPGRAGGTSTVERRAGGGAGGPSRWLGGPVLLLCLHAGLCVSGRGGSQRSQLAAADCEGAPQHRSRLLLFVLPGTAACFQPVEWEGTLRLRKLKTPKMTGFKLYSFDLFTSFT